MAIFPVGDRNIDSFLLGESWTGNTGQSFEVEYTIGSGYDGVNVEYNTLQVPHYFQDSVEEAIIQWSKTANISFAFQQSSAVNQTFNESIPMVITLGDVSSLGAGVLGFSQSITQGTKIVSNRIVIDEDFGQTDFRPGGLGYLTILHEIGHSLGLAHPDLVGTQFYNNEDDELLDSNLRILDATTMLSEFPPSGSFSGFDSLPETPQAYDIQAIQYLYGASNYNFGNTAYTFTGNEGAQTIWDAGGFDEILQGNVNVNQVINISGGAAESNINGAQIYFAIGSNIENIISGGGNDELVGNNLNNFVYGGDGGDTIVGFGGNDTLDGVGGIDAVQIIGDDVFDIALFNTSNQSLTAGTVIANFESVDAKLATEALFINGDAQNNTIQGGLGGDTINGGQGNDVIDGGFSSHFAVSNLGVYTQKIINDLDTTFDQYIAGGEGASLIFSRNFVNGNQGNDTIKGGNANDSLRGGRDNDEINGNLGNDLIFGDLGNDTLRGGQGGDNIFGGDGNDRLIGDLGELDELTGGDGADTFVFKAFNNSATVIIYDFSSAENDKIEFSSGSGNFISPGEVLSALTVVEPNPMGTTALEVAGYSEIAYQDALGNTSTIQVLGAVQAGGGGFITTLTAADFDIV